MPGVADAAFRTGLALADRAGGFALVSDDAAVPADRSRRLGRGRRAATAGARRLAGGTMLRKLYDWTLDLAAHTHATWWLGEIALAGTLRIASCRARGGQLVCLQGVAVFL